jgi:hypothetical protein
MSLPFWEQTRLFLKALSESVCLGVSPLTTLSWFEFGDRRKVLNRYKVNIPELAERRLIARCRGDGETYTITELGLAWLKDGRRSPPTRKRLGCPA